MSKFDIKFTFLLKRGTLKNTGKRMRIFYRYKVHCKRRKERCRNDVTCATISDGNPILMLPFFSIKLGTRL